MTSNTRQTIRDSVNGISDDAKRLGALYLEKAKLITTEKLSITLSSIAFSAVIIAIGIVCLVFISIGIGHLLASSIAPHLAYLIVAAFYVLLLIVALRFKRQLFVDPITRFMSRIILDDPEGEDDAQLDELAHQIARIIKDTKTQKENLIEESSSNDNESEDMNENEGGGLS